MIRTKAQAEEDLVKRLTRMAKKTNLAQRCRTIAIHLSTTREDRVDYYFYEFQRGKLSIRYDEKRYSHLGGDDVEVRRGTRTLFKAHEIKPTHRPVPVGGLYKVEIVTPALEKITPMIDELYRSARHKQHFLIPDVQYCPSTD